MILSNVEIARALAGGQVKISPLAVEVEELDPALPPFNTSSIDLRLAPTISEFREDKGLLLRPRVGGIAGILGARAINRTIDDEQPYVLRPGKFILAQTIERVEFPLPEEEGRACYSARVEGRSSLARCGVLVHFTAPTIHAGFAGNITLEIINLGPYEVLLELRTYICQLIVEEVSGVPVITPSQFRGQTTPLGNK